MIVSGMSGNEIYCLGQKHLHPGEIVVGNSVRSLGLGGALGSFGQSLAGGELGAVTQLIAEGRHAAITRMEQEAQRHAIHGAAWLKIAPPERSLFPRRWVDQAGFRRLNGRSSRGAGWIRQASAA